MEDIKDIYMRVYKKCPQDGETLYKFIMALMKIKTYQNVGIMPVFIRIFY